MSILLNIAKRYICKNRKNTCLCTTTKSKCNYYTIIETVTSIEVANMIGKEHCQLLKDIRRYINQLGKVNFDFSDFFQESAYISE